MDVTCKRVVLTTMKAIFKLISSHLPSVESILPFKINGNFKEIVTMLNRYICNRIISN